MTLSNATASRTAPTPSLREVTSAAGRRNNLDALRLFFAILVIWSHSYPMLRSSDATEPLNLLSGGQSTGGSLAVNAFFILSGYLISLSWDRRPELRDFLRRRASRIFPGYIAAVLLSLSLAPVAAGGVLHGYWRSLVIQYGTMTIGGKGVPGIFPNNPLAGGLNGSLWTIRYEWWCYVLVALLGVFGMFRDTPLRRAVLLGLLIGSTAVWAGMTIGVLTVPGTHFPVFGSVDAWPRFLAVYMAGVCAYRFAAFIPFSSRAAAACAILYAAVLLTGAPHGGVALLTPLAFAYLLLYAAYSPRLRLWDLSKRIGGDYSYGTYLYAWLVQQFVVLWIGVPNLTPTTLFVLSLVATAPLAVLSWHLVEKKFLNR